MPKSRFIGNMLVLYKSSSGKPSYVRPLLDHAPGRDRAPLYNNAGVNMCFLLSTKVHIGVQIACRPSCCGRRG